LFGTREKEPRTALAARAAIDIARESAVHVASEPSAAHFIPSHSISSL
jgi:hypothetical protein